MTNGNLIILIVVLVLLFGGRGLLLETKPWVGGRRSA